MPKKVKKVVRVLKCVPRCEDVIIYLTKHHIVKTYGGVEV